MTQAISPATASDTLRQIVNLIGAPMIWLSSSLGIFLPNVRSPQDFSDLSENLLVPFGAAFSIWFPIFIGITIYGIVQMLPRNKTRTIFRATGWWIAAGFWLCTAWGLITAYAPDGVVELTATLVFIPAMLSLVVAMVKLSRGRAQLSGAEIWTVLVPISLIAGWCSIAVFVGANGLIFSYVQNLGWSAVGTALSVLSLALGWAIVVLRRGATNRAYAFPIIWGLAFLALRHLGQAGGTTIIGGAAILGIFIVIATAVYRPRDFRAP